MLDKRIIFDTLYNQPLSIGFQRNCNIFLFNNKFGPELKKEKLSNLPISTIEFFLCMSYEGVFLSVRDILQSTVFLDHPVVKKEPKINFFARRF